MQTTPVERPAEPGYMTIAQLIVSGLGAALSLLGAALLGLLGIVGVMSESPELAGIGPLFTLAWVSGLVAVLAIPSVFFSARRFWPGWPVMLALPGFRIVGVLILLWPLTLALGMLASESALAWLFLPPLQILAIALPIWFIVELVRRGLPAGSHQRGWGVFNFSVFLTTPTAVVVEVIVFVLLGAGVVLWISGQPELVEELERLSQRIMLGSNDPEAILEAALPFLQNPLVITGLFALLAGLTPLLEELIKPAALWALAGRRLTPAEGFVGGALCGGAFALIESLMTLSSITGPAWAGLAVGRAGTGLLHIGTTALVGWGMASAWSEGKYLRLGLAYLAASAYHGLWNFLSLLPGIAAVLDPAPAELSALVSVGRYANGLLIFLSALMLLVLVRMNRQLQPVPAPEAIPGVPGREVVPPSAGDPPAA